MVARGLQRLVVSAPFGNYVQPAGATATLGTFTAQRRPGRVWRILRTVRYYPRLRAWVNKIGLRNPGVDWLVDRVRAGRIDPGDKLVSVHGFSADEWWRVLDAAAGIGPLGIELNMSCPNVGRIEWPEELFARAVATGAPIVVKLPPVRYELIFAQAWAAGVRTFHCCNTLPVAAGGVSGQPLKPVALQCIGRLPELVAGAAALRVIGGGGIRGVADIDDYAAAGVQHVAVGTKVMNPLYLVTDRPLRPLIARADELLADRPCALAAGGAVAQVS